MKALWIGTILAILSLVITSCGIAQDKYDAVVSERDAAKTQVASAQADLDKTKALATSAQADLEKSKALATSTQGDLEKAKALVTSTQGDLDKAKALVKTLQDDLSAARTKYSELESQNATAASQIESLKQQAARLKTLTIYTVAFCSGQPDANKYTAKPDNTYRVGESVWVYHELIGWKFAVTGSKLSVDFESEFKVLDDKGELVNRYVNTTKRDYDRPLSYFWYSKEYPGLKAGTYTLQIAVQDKTSGDTATWKGTFKVIS